MNSVKAKVKVSKYFVWALDLIMIGVLLYKYANLQSFNPNVIFIFTKVIYISYNIFAIILSAILIFFINIIVKAEKNDMNDIENVYEGLRKNLQDVNSPYKISFELIRNIAIIIFCFITKENFLAFLTTVSYVSTIFLYKKLVDTETLFSELVIKKQDDKFNSLGGNLMKVKDFISQSNFYFPVINCIVLSELEETLDGGPNVNMKCDIMNISRNEDLDEGSKKAYTLYLNFESYRKHNEKVAIPCFYDKEGKPTLTWMESKVYNKGIIELVLMEDDDIEKFFTWKKYDSIQEIYNDIIKLCPYEYKREKGSNDFTDGQYEVILCISLNAIKNIFERHGISI